MNLDEYKAYVLANREASRLKAMSELTLSVLNATILAPEQKEDK
jgi:hypothetical protein